MSTRPKVVHHHPKVTGHSLVSACREGQPYVGSIRMLVAVDWAVVTCRLCLRKKPNAPREVDLEPVACPSCDGTANYLGRLGARDHYRCVHCGQDFSHA